MEDAEIVAGRLREILGGKEGEEEDEEMEDAKQSDETGEMDPEPMLRIAMEDKALEQMDEKAFLKQVVSCLLFFIPYHYTNRLCSLSSVAKSSN